MIKWTPQIDVNVDDVRIDGTIVLRPAYVGAKEWMDYWEFLKVKSKSSLFQNSHYW